MSFDYHWLATTLWLTDQSPETKSEAKTCLWKAVQLGRQYTDFEVLGRVLWEDADWADLARYAASAIRSLSGIRVLLKAAWAWRPVFLWLAVLFLLLLGRLAMTLSLATVSSGASLYSGIPEGSHKAIIVRR